jgi:hypothetical protein
MSSSIEPSMTGLNFGAQELVSQMIFPHLEDTDVLNFRAVCKLYQTIASEKFLEVQDYRRNRFPYGIISKSEENPKSLEARITKTLNLPKALTTDEMVQLTRYDTPTDRKLIDTHIKNNPVFLSFDTEGNPTAVEYKTLFHPEASFYQRWKEKYDFFRGKFHKPSHAIVSQIFSHHNEVANEFLETELNSQHPLQSLRNCCYRLKTMEEERRCLLSGLKSSEYSYQKFYKELSLFEKVTICVVSFFHSFYAPAFNISSRPQLKVTNWKDLNDAKTVKFGETEITFNGKIIPVEIVAKFDHGFNKTWFDIIEKSETKKLLGYLEILRGWDDNSIGYYTEEVAGVPEGGLTNRRLYIPRIQDDLKMDSCNNDMTVKRLLTQIAVEILERENEDTLAAEAQYNEVDVYLNAGFYCYDEQLTAKILNETKNAKKLGKLFPDNKDRHTNRVHLHKDRSKSDSLGTQFIKVDDKDNQLAAEVNLDFDSPKTWEEQIEAHRLLSGTGPVLPKFMKRNLFEYEAR